MVLSFVGILAARETIIQNNRAQPPVWDNLLQVVEIPLQMLMDAVVDYLPSPLDLPPTKGEDSDGNETEVSPNDSGKVAGLANTGYLGCNFL